MKTPEISRAGLVLDLPLYKLDGSKFMSADAYGHLCTNYGSIWTPRGRVFDGIDDYISIPHHVAFNLTTEATMEVWASPGVLGLANRFIIHKGTAYLLAPTSGSVWEIQFNNGGIYVQGTSVFTLGNMYHVVGTYSSLAGLMQIYVKGVREITKAGTVTIATNTSAVEVGRYQEAEYYFTGIVGEARLYNRVLSPQEILNNYLATKWRYR